MVKCEEVNVWDHFVVLPYEVVVETIDEKGKITYRELISREGFLKEAMRIQGGMQSTINSKTHRCVIDRPFANHKEGSE